MCQTEVTCPICSIVNIYITIRQHTAEIRKGDSQLYLLKSVLCIDDIERKNTESKVWYGLQQCINCHYAWITLSNIYFCFFKVTCPSKICFALLEVFSCHTAFF